jgi:hypothetical protein
MDRIRATRAWKELDKNAKEKSLDDAARLNAIINSSKES